ncbi:MAG: YqiA/YcfP family alpha/beta fold hydrolase [Kofleriaceae bacterium]
MTSFLYLHGFASGPRSTKGMAFAEHFARRGISIERLDLRVPSFEHLRLSAMLDTAGAAIRDDRAVVFGSSLGGLTAARLAERDRRVVALVLMAPAFRLVERWQQLLGAEWDAWAAAGWREVHDYTTNQPARIDFGFVEDVRAIDRGLPVLGVPTLILHGTHDDVVPIETSRELARLHQNVTLVELDDGHELVASLSRLLSEAERFVAAHS